MPKVKKMNENFRPITETYKNLTDGQVFKNYNALCEFLCQPIGKGNSKISQVEQFKLYFEYEITGHKITILNVYDMPLFNYSSGMYSSLIQKLILDNLVNEVKNNNHRLLVSGGQLMYQLHMVNARYRNGKHNKCELHEVLDIPINSVNEFYMITDSKLIKLIESTLNSLRRSAHIQYNKVLAICVENHVSIASEFIRRIIIKYESIVFNELGCKDIIEVIYRNMYGRFNKRVLELINCELDGMLVIDYYYTAYDIVIGDRILEESDKLNQYMLDNKIEVLKALNDLIVSRHKEGYVRRNNDTWDKLAEDIEYKKGYRISDSYVDNGHRLIDYTMTRKYD